MNKPQTRILVVDDAPLMRGLMIQILHKYGYAVDTVENGQQAIEYFIHHHPDLILMDADMPVMDGVDACIQLRQLPAAKYLPIIMVTALTEREWVDKAFKAGATDYITKPVNWDVLRNRIHYILQAKHAEEALFAEKEKAQVTLASIGDGVITTDAEGLVEYLNTVATQLTGWTPEQAKGLPINQVFSIIDEVTQQPINFPLERCLQEGKKISLSNNTVLLHRDGQKRFAIEDSAAPICDRKGQTIGIVLVFHDVTQNRKMTRKLYYDATHDALTGLFNLHEFKIRLGNLLKNLEDKEHALLYMDLDHFKTVNDTCGHEAGDQLLKDVAFLLQRKINDYTSADRKATLARLGGDEFGLLLENCPLPEAFKIAHNLCEIIENFRFFWGDGKHEKSLFTIGISIGLMPVSVKTVHQKSVLAMADAACYAAKNAGRNGVHIYQCQEAVSLDEEIQWVTLINDYLDLERDKGFSLFYQPIAPLRANSKERYYEIFLRMHDPKGQLVPPGAFLSVAGRHNLLSLLDLWVVRHLLQWLSEHPEHTERFALLAINLSVHSLSDSYFVETITRFIQRSQIPTHKLCFEITETSAITNLTATVNFMNMLKKLGCRVAIDDFGSGISSFNYIKNLSLDFLKINGGLVKNIVKDKVDYAMVKTINDISHLMNIQTIAEFVEKEEIFHSLKEIQVDYVQGFWIAEPQPLDFILLK